MRVLQSSLHSACNMLRHAPPCSGVCVKVPKSMRGCPRPRFWHDEQRFKGTGHESLVQRALLGAGGRRTGGPLKHDPVMGPWGWQRMGAWDVLWSPASTAHKVGAGRARGRVGGWVGGWEAWPHAEVPGTAVEAR